MVVNVRSPGFMAVGNFDSNEGYAWKLMHRFWCELAGIASDKGCSTYVVFPTVSAIPELLLEAGCNVDALDFGSSSFRSTMNQLRFIKERSIELMYFTDYPTYSWKFFLYRLVGVKKIIVHDHTPGVRSKPGVIREIVKKFLNRIPLFSCTAAIAVSPYVAERLVKVNGLSKGKVFCVTNGIDVEGGHLPIRAENRPSVVRIVTVGRVCYYKGIDFALEVVNLLVQSNSIDDFEYLIVGDGPDFDEFNDKSKRLGLENRVRFLGSVDNVSDILLECDIAFHPSRGEAMSLAILEYMRAGLAIVASDNPSVSSTLVPNKDALIYKEANVESAAKLIKLLIESSERRQELGTAAHEHVVSNFSSAIMLRKFRTVLAKLAE